MGNAIYRKSEPEELPSSIITQNISIVGSDNIKYQNELIYYGGRSYCLWLLEKGPGNWSIVLHSSLENGSDETTTEIQFSIGAVKIKVIFYIFSGTIYYAWYERDYYTDRRFIVTGKSGLNGEGFSYLRHASTEVFSFDRGWDLNKIEVYGDKIYLSLNGDLASIGYYQNYMATCNLDNSEFALHAMPTSANYHFSFVFTIFDDVIYYAWTQRVSSVFYVYIGASDLLFNLSFASSQTSLTHFRNHGTIKYHNGKIYYMWEDWNSTTEIYS